MQTKRTLSRPTLTVQNMTVCSTEKPTLPSVDTPRCDLRPSPSTAATQPTRRRERFSCTFGQALLTSYGALLPVHSFCAGNKWKGTRNAFHPLHKCQGLSSDLRCKELANKAG